MKLVYTVPATELETNHVHVEFTIVSNPEGKLSAVGQLFNHSCESISRIDFTADEVKTFEVFMGQLMGRLCEKAGVKEKQ